MTSVSKFLARTGVAIGAGAVLAAAPAAPAVAQVDGRLATVSVERALLGTSGLQTAFNQVSTTYQAQVESAQAKQDELQALLQPFDTNRDSNIDQSETAALQASPTFQQIQTLQGEVAAIEEQVTAAQVYAVEQVLIQYQTALSEVATQQQVVMVVSPASLQYASEGADITAAVSSALDTKVPTVAIVPPQGWRPNPRSVQVFQDINRLLLIQQARQQQAAQQGQQPATEPPTGR
ncbi:MAG: OmpH family outer membrane protein [Erythrobacter sp.]|jgi:Skp family chaperone for outer membrane proteins|nr:OmpH family outer membrane protein [Erythrobacter sp.]